LSHVLILYIFLSFIIFFILWWRLNKLLTAILGWLRVILWLLNGKWRLRLPLIDRINRYTSILFTLNRYLRFNFTNIITFSRFTFLTIFLLIWSVRWDTTNLFHSNLTNSFFSFGAGNRLLFVLVTSSCWWLEIVLDLFHQNVVSLAYVIYWISISSWRLMVSW